MLFLDELAEFPGSVLDNLRQPLEEGRVVVCRASAAVAFPARFMLVAAMNACRCGADGAPGSCRCTESARARYAARISGPLLDRFDLRVRVRRPDVEALLGAREAGGRVREARSTPPSLRPSSPPELKPLGDVPRRCGGCAATRKCRRGSLEQAAPLSAGARRLLERRLRDGRLSARGLDRARRVALTVADLAGYDGPLSEEHVLLALALREPEPLGAEPPPLSLAAAEPLATSGRTNRSAPLASPMLGLVRP